VSADFVFAPRLLRVWTIAVLVFVLAPLAVVVLISFTTREYISLPVEGVTLRWYREAFENPAFVESAINSLVLAMISGMAVLVIGTMLAVAAVRSGFWAKGLLNLLGTSPLFVPMVMIALAVLIAGNAYGVYSPATRLLVGHCVLTLPYVFRTVASSLTGFDMNQELAARNLGASPWKAFLKVTLPQLAPGVLAGGVFAFIVSFDNVGLSIFLTGPDTTTLPVQLYVYSSHKSDPMIAAVSVLMIVFSLGVVAAVERFFGLQRLMRA